MNRQLYNSTTLREPLHVCSIIHSRTSPSGSTARHVKAVRRHVSRKVTIFMGPDHQQTSTGVMTSQFQLQGLYLHQEYVGDAQDGPFPSFQGQGYWGYNTSAGKYEGFWIDNASTMMQVEQGDVNADGKIWEMIGNFTHPATGEKIRRRSVITLIDEDHHRMDSYMSGPDGKEIKSMEIEYVRTNGA